MSQHHGLPFPVPVLPAPDFGHHLPLCSGGCYPVLPPLPAQSCPLPGRPGQPVGGHQGKEYPAAMSVLKHLYELSLVRHWLLIGCLQEGARKAALLENNNLVSHYYNDAKTMYEVFQRGLKVSGDGSLYFFFFHALRKPPFPKSLSGMEEN